MDNLEIFLSDFNEQRAFLHLRGMQILLSIAISNILVSAILIVLKKGLQFNSMNIGWNLVNLIIAAFGIYQVDQTAGTLNLAASIDEIHSLIEILLFNSGLDIGYIFLGLWLISKSKLKESSRLKSFGLAIIYNGFLLFVFDIAFSLVLKSHESALLNYIENLY